MKASKAVMKTRKARVKIIFKNAITMIKSTCESGMYFCKIEIANSSEDYEANIINEEVFSKLKSYGYRLGSTVQEKVYSKHVFWDIKQKTSN